MLRLVFLPPLLALAGCGPTTPTADAGAPLLTCDAAAVARPTRIAAPLPPVRPGVLSESVLWLKLNGRAAGPNGEALGGVMPPGGKLDDATLKLVKDWICTGAK